MSYLINKLIIIFYLREGTSVLIISSDISAISALNPLSILYSIFIKQEKKTFYLLGPGKPGSYFILNMEKKLFCLFVC